MPNYPVASSQGRYRLGAATSTPGTDGDIAWAEECADDSQDVLEGTDISYYAITSGTDRVNLIRNVIFFDTTGLSPTLEIENAGIWVELTYCQNIALTKIADTINIVLCPDIHRPAVEADYGYLGDCGTIVGSLYIPVDLPTNYRYIPLNDVGIAAINAGGITPFGIRPSRDINVNFPGWDTQFCVIFGTAYLRINDPVFTGYIWVEGTKFAYLDHYRDKRLKEGTLVSGVASDTFAWVDGVYQYYTDHAGGVRRIEGTLTGLTGKLPSQISINTKAPMYGTHYCYIGDDGAERCFEGTPA